MLSSDRRRAVKDLLEAALQYEPASRADFIRGASHGDTLLSDAALRVLEAIEAKRIDSGSSSSSESDLLAEALLESTDSPAETTEDTIALREFRGTSRFEVRRKLGSGGFGTVYESYDREQHQSVALKVLRRTDPAFLYRFKREFRALVDIRHRNLVELYELFQERQFWFFTMELVRGVNFLEYVEHRSQSNVATGRAACNIDRLRAALLELSEGVLALHSARILHRDIKPGNVLVSPDGRVRLLDFGLVRELELSNLQSVMLIGTPAYMSPEQLAQRPYDSAADWYSLGVMLFQALTGSLPARETQPGRSSPSTLLSALVDVPDDLSQLCLDLLNADATKRPTGEELRARLGAARPVARAVSADIDELFIGREQQLQQLTRLLGLTRQGRAVVVNLYGQSGVGKSAVIRAFRRRLARTEPDVVILTGRCHENETVPFKALDSLVDDLSRHLSALPSVESEALTPRDAASLIRVFPVLAQVDAIANVRRKGIDIVDAQELRQRAFASLQDLFVRLAERQTVVIAIDDLQWGDLDSVAFLRGLFSGRSLPSVLLIASYRMEDADTSPFLRAWRSSAEAEGLAIEQMPLGELTYSESQELALRLLQSRAGDTGVQVASIARESGGSPFLIEQLAQYTKSEGEEKAGLNLRAAIEYRLSQLPARSRRLVETIAVAGQPLSESIAYVAAECEFSDRPTLFTLVADHFLRVRETNDSRQIEIYHDRLREMIVASMPRESRQQCHLNLAVALEADVAVDPAVLSVHRREAGDLDRASQYAWAAGDQASNALAFERAAEWYQLALESGKWNSVQATALRKSLAEACASAGRGARAAEVYLEAAKTADHDRRPELQRLAAEQLLRAGHLDEGLTVLEAIARQLGMWLPAKPWQTLLSLLAHRLRAALPVFPLKKLSKAQAARHLITLDVYWSFLVGLTNFDPIRAMDFHARHRLLATRLGDAKRLSLSLAMEAASRAASGDYDTRRIDDLIKRARALCEGTHSPEALGLIATLEALCASVLGNWRAALRLADEADRFLAERCSGVAWERATSLQLLDAAIFYLGEWRTILDYAQRFPNQAEEATLRGDVHAGVASFSGRALPLLIADQPLLAAQFIQDTIAVLPRNRFLMPRVWMLNLEVYMALYSGDGDRAWDLVSSHWPALKASQFLRVDYLAIVSLEFRARAAIAAAAMDATRKHHLRDAMRCARKLSRKEPIWAHAFSMLIRAAVASVRRERKATVELLERAEAQFLAADMAHYVAACQYRRGMSIGGERGPALVATAEAWANSQGIVNPARIFNMLAPGRWESV